MTAPQGLAVHRQDRLLHAGFRHRRAVQRPQPAEKARVEEHVILMRVVGPAVEMGGQKLGSAGVAFADGLGRFLLGQTQPLGRVRDAIGQGSEQTHVQGGSRRQNAAGSSPQQNNVALNAQSQDGISQLQHRRVQVEVLLPQPLQLDFDPLAGGRRQLVGQVLTEVAFLSDILEHFLPVDFPAEPGADPLRDAGAARTRFPADGN